MSVSFPLVHIHGGRDSLSRRLSFAQTKEAKFGAVLFVFFYLLAFLADLFVLDINTIPLMLVSIFGLILTFMPFSKYQGKAILTQDSVIVKPASAYSPFPSGDMKLNEIEYLDIFTIKKLRFISSFLILQFIIKYKENEYSFGIQINSRREEEQYLEQLDSWYRNGYPVREFDELGGRIFKITKGKNYADVQRIKKEYEIEW